MKNPQAVQSSSSSVIPTFLRQEKTISIASESPEPLLSDDDDSTVQQEEEEQEKEQKKEEQEKEQEETTEEDIGFQFYIVELNIVLDKKTIYNSSIKSTKFDFECFEQDVLQRASDAAGRANKNTEFCGFETSI